MARSLAIVPLLVLVTMGLALPAAPVGADTAPGAGSPVGASIDTGDGAFHDRPALRAGVTAGAVANNTSQHENPQDLDAGDDVGDVTRWLERRLGADLERSAIELSRDEADLAKRLLGEEFTDQFERYAYVAGRTETTDDDRTSEQFRETKETQEQFATAVQEYRETRDAYEEARQNGNETLARRLARELQRLSQRTNRTGTALRRDYGALSNATVADLSEASVTIQGIRLNISRQQAEVVRETFVRTTLTLRPDSRRISFLDPLELTGRLAGENGSTLAERIVRLRIGGQTIRTQTNADGAFAVSFRPTLLRTDEQTVTVRYVPRNESIYLGSNESLTVSVSQTTPNLSVERPPDAVAYDDRIDVRGTLGAEGIGAGGVPVTVQFGGAPLGTTRTESDGSYSLESRVPASVDDGERALTVTVPLTQRALAGVDRSWTVTVDPTETVLTVSGEQVRQESVRIRGTLETARSSGIPDQSVELMVDGESVATARTGPDGGFAQRVSLPDDVAPADGNVSMTLTARYERPDSSLRPARANTTLRLRSIARDTGGADGPAGLAGLFRLPEAVSVPLVAAATVGALFVLAGVIYFRRSYTSEAADPNPDGPFDSQSSRQTMEPTDSSLGDRSSTLSGATAALDDDRRDTAVKLAYMAIKQVTVERLGLPDGTHWEFFVACREAGFDEERIDALRRLTETYERAAFAPDSVSMEDANWVVDTASTFDPSTDDMA